MAGRGDDAMRTEKTAGSRRRRLNKPKPHSSFQKSVHNDWVEYRYFDFYSRFLKIMTGEDHVSEENDSEENVSEENSEEKVSEENVSEENSEEYVSLEDVSEDDTEDTLGSETEDDDDEVPQNTLRVAPVKTQLYYTIPVDIQAAEKPLKTTVELTVDPGSAVSVLPRCVYEEHFKDVPLRHSTAVRMIGSRGPMVVQGRMQATVHRNGVQVPADFYVMDSGTTALMGRVLISALHLHVEA